MSHFMLNVLGMDIYTEIPKQYLYEYSTVNLFENWPRHRI